MSKPQVIGAPQSNFVWAVRMLAEERGVAYDLVPERPHQGEAKRINPFGKIPVLKHGEFELSESRAIAGYLDALGTGTRLFPSDAKAAAEVEQWVSIGNTAADPVLLRRYVVQYVMPRGPDGTPNRAVIDGAVKEMGPLLDAYQAKVAKTGYVAGNAFSYADCVILPMLHYTGRFPEGKEALAARPGLTAYLAQHSKRPSFVASAPPPPKSA
jgi:glutathione S-transferase